MPPPLPPRYHLEVRLGRDHDIEEWLATDVNLDRPVLIRFLGPDASQRRRSEFLATVRQAAAVVHPHLEPIFAAAEVEEGAFAVSEWNGGLTLQSRLAAGEILDYAEFSQNAPGLAGALAALHQAGMVHGAIDPGSILYTVTRPARLGGFGRPSRFLATAIGDVAELAAVLEQSLTGLPPGGPPPSEVVDGVPAEVDSVLALARAGQLDASGLAHALEAAPRPQEPKVDVGRTWRVPALAAGLIVIAAGLIALGRFLAGTSGVPVIPGPSATAPTGLEVSTTATTTPSGVVGPVVVIAAATFDPYGGGGENDEDIEAIIDRNQETTWRTERYHDPLELLKPGVGVTVTVAGRPGSIELIGLAAGASFNLFWSAQQPPDPDDWETIASGRTGGGRLLIQVPVRDGGNWLLWFSSLPRRTDGSYWTNIAEIRFDPSP
ncbi:MAG: hypothetical protein ACT4OP_12485 [Actinomycetota bacterium]